MSKIWQVWPILFLALSLSAQDEGLSPEETYIQEVVPTDLKDQFKELFLKEVLEQGGRTNRDQQIRELKEKLRDLKWSDSFESFWLPDVNLELETDKQRIMRLRSGGKRDDRYSKNPSGSLGLSFGEYTIFNWGKDFANYLNQRDRYKRDKEQFKEKRRDLKHQLITQYFYLLTTKRIAKLELRQLRRATYIYRLNRERVTLKKVSKEEYYQSRSEFLRAQKEYEEAKIAVAMADEKMALTLGAPAGTRYLIKEELLYRPLKTDLSDILVFAAQNSSAIKEAQTNLVTSHRSYEISLKDQLPLPKFTIELGAYTHYFGKQTNETYYETRTGNSDIEIVAMLKATWNIVGDGGLFNSRKVAKSFVNKELSQKELVYAKEQTYSQIKRHFQMIQYLEKQIKVLESQNTSLQKTYDTILSNYTNKTTRFLNLKEALIDLTQNEVALEKLKFDHLNKKVQLANVVGIEDFPGDLFENLTQQVGEATL